MEGQMRLADRDTPDLQVLMAAGGRGMRIHAKSTSSV